MIGKNNTWLQVYYYGLVFFCGFANLATEIIGPRMVSSMFGNTTEIWAIIISITLIGISVGYFIGGRVPVERIPRVLPLVLIGNAIWLVLVGWVIWLIPSSAVDVGYVTVFVTAFAAFFLPAVLFSTVSPMVVGMLTATQRNVGNIYSFGTVGSVVGALLAAFYLIPFFGLSASLRLFALILVALTVIFLILCREGVKLGRHAGLPLLVLALVIGLPQPSYQWESDLTLLEQTEGYYQTIRVYTDNQKKILLHLGPSFQAEMDLITKEPLFGYAKTMVEISGDVAGKRLLIIGGAGHTMARSFERRGADVTEIEIDPRVVQVSDRHFGSIKGEVVVTDGRAFIEAGDDTFDIIYVDAFDGSVSVPPQLVTREFFEAARRRLNPGGRVMFNFIGHPQGVRSASVQFFTATMKAVFPIVKVSETEGERLVNLVFVASMEPVDDIPYADAPWDGQVLTDDLNPIDVLLRQAREGIYYRR